MFSKEESPLQKYIYIFELSGNKKFLYSSFHKNENEIILEATLYYDYLKTYPIISIYDKRIERSGFDIDGYTKEYMYFHGIENIRGGSYSAEILTKQEEEVLLQELKTVDDFHQKPREYYITLLLEEYKNRLHNKNEIQTELNNILHKRNQYNIEKERFQQFKPLIPSIYLFEDRMKTLMNQYLDRQHHTPQEPHFYPYKYTETIKKYRNIIKQIKDIYKIMETHFASKIEVGDEDLTIYYKHPEFLFDNFIYRGITGSPISVIKVCNAMIFFSNVILNRISEYEFDYLSHRCQDDWVFSRRIFYLEQLLCDRS